MIKKPEITKNTSTPRKPPGNKFTDWWNKMTATTANARKPSSAGEYAIFRVLWASPTPVTAAMLGGKATRPARPKCVPRVLSANRHVRSRRRDADSNGSMTIGRSPARRAPTTSMPGMSPTYHVSSRVETHRVERELEDARVGFHHADRARIDDAFRLRRRCPGRPAGCPRSVRRWPIKPSALETMPSRTPVSASARKPSRAPGSSRSHSAASANSLSRCSWTSSRSSSGVPHAVMYAVEVLAPARRPVEFVVDREARAHLRSARGRGLSTSAVKPARANAPIDTVVRRDEEDAADVEQARLSAAGNGYGTSKTYRDARDRLVPLRQMEFRRINALPPYAFAQIDALKMAAAASRRGRHRPRVRQPRHAVARRRGREAHRSGAQPAQPSVLDEQGHSRSCAMRSPTSTSASSVSRSTSRPRCAPPSVRRKASRT